MRISYSALYQSAKTMAMAIERDLPNFEAAGIKVELFNQFKQKTDELILDSDQMYNIKKIQATDLKDQLDKQLRMELRQLLIIESRVLKGAANGRTGVYEGGISGTTSNDLIAAYVNTITSVRSHLNLLSDFGIDEAYVVRLETLLAQYSQALVDREKAVYERDIAARNRQARAQELYNDLSFFAQMGKAIFGGVDEAKYNDYVLGFGSSHKTQTSEPETAPETVPPDDGTTGNEATAPDDETLVLQEPNLTQF